MFEMSEKMTRDAFRANESKIRNIFILAFIVTLAVQIFHWVEISFLNADGNKPLHNTLNITMAIQSGILSLVLAGLGFNLLYQMKYKYYFEY